MSQEVTEKTQTALTDKNEIRPYDKVKIRWIFDKHLEAGTEEEVHPVFAEKMVKAGKAEYFDKATEKSKK